MTDLHDASRFATLGSIRFPPVPTTPDDFVAFHMGVPIDDATLNTWRMSVQSRRVFQDDLPPWTYMVLLRVFMLVEHLPAVWQGEDRLTVTGHQVTYDVDRSDSVGNLYLDFGLDRLRAVYPSLM